MYVSICMNSRAIYLCMNIGLSSARACFRERANHFSRAMAPKSGAVHAPIPAYMHPSSYVKHIGAHGGLHRDKST